MVRGGIVGLLAHFVRHGFLLGHRPYYTFSPGMNHYIPAIPDPANAAATAAPPVRKMDPLTFPS